VSACWTITFVIAAFGRVNFHCRVRPSSKTAITVSTSGHLGSAQASSMTVTTASSLSRRKSRVHCFTATACAGVGSRAPAGGLPSGSKDGTKLGIGGQ